MFGSGSPSNPGYNGREILREGGFFGFKPNPKLSLLIYLASILGGLLILSNFLAAKIIKLGPLPFFIDGGTVSFPLIYIFEDLLVEFYGKKIANKVALATTLVNLAAIGLIFICERIPGASGVGNVSLVNAFGLTGRIMLASSISFFVSQVCNNSVFENIRKRTGRQKLLLRSLSSSFMARVIDTIIFNVLAFAGRSSFGDLVKQTSGAFIMASLIELFLSPLLLLITFLVRKKISR